MNSVREHKRFWTIAAFVVCVLLSFAGGYFGHDFIGQTVFRFAPVAIKQHHCAVPATPPTGTTIIEDYGGYPQIPLKGFSFTIPKGWGAGEITATQDTADGSWAWHVWTRDNMEGQSDMPPNKYWAKGDGFIEDSEAGLLHVSYILFPLTPSTRSAQLDWSFAYMLGKLQSHGLNDPWAVPGQMPTCVIV